VHQICSGRARLARHLDEEIEAPAQPEHLGLAGRRGAHQLQDLLGAPAAGVRAPPVLPAKFCQTHLKNCLLKKNNVDKSGAVCYDNRRRLKNQVLLV
jgi:hypothetical protein